MITRRATIVVATAVVIMLAGCSEVKHRLYRPPTIALRNVAVEGVGLTGGSLRVALLVHNPNFYSLSTAGMRYQLLVGDSVMIASGTDSTHRRVAANDSVIVELPVHVSWQGITAAGSAVAASGMVPYQIVGTITLDTPLGTHDVPVNQRGSFAPLR
ncbi:MAG TPA: LEA type 2 family protein [Gemmatimonadaceae bacterium]